MTSAAPGSVAPARVARPRVTRRLRVSARRRIVVVHGRAGCGKSVAIEQHLAMLKEPVVTFAVGAEHAGVAAFARGLTEALAPVAPRALKLLPAAVSSARRQSNSWRSIATWLAEQLERPVVIAVDQLHRIDESDAAFGFLVAMAEASGGYVRWILGTRSTAALPLPRWLASGLADASVDEFALRFEAGDVPDLAASLETDAALIEWLRERNDGCIGAIVAGAGDVSAPREDPGAPAGNWEAAARSLEAAGNFGAALQWYVAARAHIDVKRILDCYGFDLHDGDAADIVFAAISALPPETRREIPIALMLEAIDESYRGRYDVSEAWFENALRLARDEAQRLRIDIAFAVELLRRGRTDAFDRLEALSRHAGGTHAVSILASLATAHASAGRQAQAEACVGQAVAALELIDDVAVRATVHQRAAFVALSAADPERAQKHAQLAASLAQEHGNDDLIAVARSVSYVVAFSYNDDQLQALEALTDIGKAAARLGNAIFRRFALIGTYLIEAERCNAPALAKLDAQLAGEEIEASLQHVEEGLMPARALQSTWSGAFDNAYALLVASGGRQSSPETRALRWAEIGLYGAIAGMTGAPDALACAHGELAAVESRHSVETLRAELLLALAALVLGRITGARELLDATATEIVRWPRFAPFHDVLAAIAGSKQECRSESLLTLLEQMHANGLGGWARMIATIPYGRLAMPWSAT